MATPDPANGVRPPKRGYRQRLRIVGHDEIVVVLQQVRVSGVVREVDLCLGITQGTLRSLQCVVHGLGDREEGLVAGYDAQVGLEAQVLQQRHLGE